MSNNRFWKFPGKLTASAVAFVLVAQTVLFALDPVAYANSTAQYDPLFRHMMEKIGERVEARYSKMNTPHKIKFLDRAQKRFDHSLKQVSKMSDDQFNRKKERAAALLQTLFKPQQESSEDQSADLEETPSQETQNLMTPNEDERAMAQEVSKEDVAQFGSSSFQTTTREDAIKHLNEAIQQLQLEKEKLQSQASHSAKTERKPAADDNGYGALMGMLSFYIILAVAGIVLIIVGAVLLVPTMGAGLALVIVGPVLIAVGVTMIFITPWGA